MTPSRGATKIHSHRTWGVLLIFLLTLASLGLSALLPPTAIRIDAPRQLKQESSGNPVLGGQFENLCRALRVGGAIAIELSGNLTNRGGLQNLVQTSDGNHGIRVEVNEAGNAAIAVAAATANGFFTRELGSIKFGKDFRISIELMKNRMRFATDSSKYKSWLGTPTLVPQCDRVMIGGGFDSTRNSAGPVRASLAVVDTPNDRSWVRVAEIFARNQSKLTMIIILIYSIDFLASAVVQRRRQSDEP